MAISIKSRTASTMSQPESSSRQRAMFGIPILLLVLYVALSFRLESEAETSEMEQIKGSDFKKEALHAKDPTETTPDASTGSAKVENSDTVDGDCIIDCDTLDSNRIDQFGKDLTDRTAMLQLASEARDKVIANIKKDYGIYFDGIFKSGFEPITADGDSIQLLRRKLQIKALTVQVNIMNEKETCKKECHILDQFESSPIYNSTFPHYTRYVWATGGHSASAGHGNLFNESYTAFMEHDLKPIFGAIGIEFEGRNFAMGGTK